MSSAFKGPRGETGMAVVGMGARTSGAREEGVTVGVGWGG